MSNKTIRIFWLSLFLLFFTLGGVKNIKADSFPARLSFRPQDNIRILDGREEWINADFLPELSEGSLGEESKILAEPKIFGYIVQFVDEPLAISKKQIKNNSFDNNEITLKITKERQNFESKFLSNKTSLSKRVSNFDRKIKREFKNVFNGLALDISAQEAEEIKKLDFVKDVYPDYEVSVFLHQSAPLINADDVWNLGYTGDGVKVAIVDTGVDYTHPAFGSCTTEEFLNGDCEKIIGGHDFVNNDNDPMDDHGHGTHVAGIVAGHVDSVITGIAPDALLLAYKVLNSAGSGSWSQVIAGIEQAYIDGADVINLSLGGIGDPDDPVAQAVDNIIEVGVVVVAAAGNSGSSYRTINTPGVSRKAITVGASSKTDVIGSFSSRGPIIWDNKSLIKPDILAPGVLIKSAVPTGSCILCDSSGYKSLSGTSMATPHIAGVVALMKQTYPDWTPEEIKMALRNTSIDLNYDYVTQGYGRVDALAATQLTSRPPLAKIIESSYEVLGEVDIVGTATSSNTFDNFSLYYGESFRPSEWKLICDSNTPVIEEILCSFNTSLINNGEYLLKLEVKDDLGQISRDYGLIRVNNLGITSVGNTNNYIKSGINVIKGYIYIPNLEEYKIEARIENGTDWQEICHESELLVPDILCSFDATGLENGKYDFRILATIDGGDIIYSGNHGVVFIEELMDNWPIRKDCFREIYVTPVDLINNGQKELLSIDSRDCGPGWNNGKIITILGNSVDTNIFRLYKDGVELRTTDHLGCLPLTILNQSIFTPLSTYTPENLKYFGVIDSGGNF
ncbi:MAG TPA: hypothetical protein ENN27_05965, partial [Candidatus Atribacteria bacterium]|nr:hypothetical protein [Candidatus Atribacteria bacterium]